MDNHKLTLFQRDEPTLALNSVELLAVRVLLHTLLHVSDGHV